MKIKQTTIATALLLAGTAAFAEAIADSFAAAVQGGEDTFAHLARRGAQRSAAPACSLCLKKL